MMDLQQIFIDSFVKRASEYGFTGEQVKTAGLAQSAAKMLGQYLYPALKRAGAVANSGQFLDEASKLPMMGNVAGHLGGAGIGGVLGAQAGNSFVNSHDSSTGVAHNLRELLGMGVGGIGGALAGGFGGRAAGQALGTAASKGIANNLPSFYQGLATNKVDQGLGAVTNMFK